MATKEVAWCKSGRGCPISEHVKYPQVTSLVDTFLNKKILENHKGYDSQISSLVSSSDLKNIDTALKLEGIFQSWLAYQQKNRIKK